MRRRSAPILAGLLFGAAALSSGCTPTSQVRRTTPVANLQTYKTVLVRVGAVPSANQHVAQLENSTAMAMRGGCSFGRVMGATEKGQVKADLIVDLNIRRTARGGGGFIKNPNLATVDVTMVLSDGLDESLLGSADIQGRSSAVLVQGSDPEQQAISAVAKRIATIMATSGCQGQRIARAPDPVPAPNPANPNPANPDPANPNPANPDPTTPTPNPANPTPTPPGVDPQVLAQAEAANDEGKRLFRAANIAAAKAQFQQAIQLHKDPRFQFNLCLAHEALGELSQADAACKQVLSSSPEPRLSEKCKQRLEIIATKRGA